MKKDKKVAKKSKIVNQNPPQPRGAETIAEDQAQRRRNEQDDSNDDGDSQVSNELPPTGNRDQSKTDLGVGTNWPVEAVSSDMSQVR